MVIVRYQIMDSFLFNGWAHWAQFCFRVITDYTYIGQIIQSI